MTRISEKPGLLGRVLLGVSHQAECVLYGRRRIVPLVLCVASLLEVCTAQTAGTEPGMSSGTTTYAFVVAESAVTHRDRSTDLDHVYIVEGQFELTVDLEAGVAVFSQAEIRAIDDTSDSLRLDLNVLFNLTALAGRVLDDATIEFWGTHGAGHDIDLTLTFEGQTVRLAGVESLGRLSGEKYTLEALAWRQYGGEVSIPCDLRTYVFLPDQIALLQTGGFWGIHRTDFIAGRFELAVDLKAGTASFVSIDAGMADVNMPIYGMDTNAVFRHVFKVTEWMGTVVNESTVYFSEETPDNSCTDAILTLTFDAETARLVADEYVSRGPCPDYLYCFVDGVAQRKYGGGIGEPNHPYLIYTAQQMNAIGADPNDWDKHFELMADIDLAPYAETDFNIIGVDANSPFLASSMATTTSSRISATYRRALTTSACSVS